MLPNHAPLVIAEQFGTLAELFPDRIDLGLGRAPGTDQQTLRALRVNPMEADNFPNDVMELQAFLALPPPNRPSAPCPVLARRSRSGSWDRAFTARSSRRCWGCHTHSRRISRPMR